MKKLTIMGLVIALVISMLSIPAVALDKNATEALATQKLFTEAKSDLSTAELKILFPNAMISEAKTIEALQKMERGIIPDSMNPNKTPIQQFTYKYPDSSFVTLKVYADGTRATYGLTQGTSVNYGYASVHTGAKVWGNQSMLFSASYYVNYTLSSGGSSITSCYSYSLSPWGPYYGQVNGYPYTPTTVAGFYFTINVVQGSITIPNNYCLQLSVTTTSAYVSCFPY